MIMNKMREVQDNYRLVSFMTYYDTRVTVYENDIEWVEITEYENLSKPGTYNRREVKTIVKM